VTPNRLFIVVNTRSGTQRGMKILQQIKPVLVSAGTQIEVHVTEHPGHAREIAGALNLEAYDGICIVGGDGTIHEIVDGLMHRNERIGIPLGFIPAGSGNTMHQHLQCSDPLDAVRRILAGRTCPLDVAHVVYCVDIVGWGAVADINCTAEKLRCLGPPRYAAAALGHILKPKRRPARLVLDGQACDDEFLFIIGCNTKFTGKGMKLAPRAEIDDGKIDVVVLRNASRFQMLKVFTKVFDGSHVALDCIEYHQVRSFAIESEGRETLDLDGEIKGTAPVAVEMKQAALRVFA
jgi:diacylglycerol kinase (ATP)